MTPEALARLHARSFGKAWDSETFKAFEKDPSVTLIAIEYGFIVIRNVADEAEILTLAVDPDHRGQGLGKELVARACSRAAEGGAERIFLEVAEDNSAASAIYAKSGFREIGRRANYYRAQDGSKTDALVLSRVLADA